MEKINKKLIFYSLLGLIPILALTIILLLSFKKNPTFLKEIKSSFPPETITSPLKESKEIIQKGMTLTDLLARHNFSPLEIHQLKEQTKPVFNLNLIKAGHEIKFFFDASGKIQSIAYAIDDLNALLIQVEGGNYKASLKEFSYKTRPEVIWGTIEDNLITAFQQKNEGDLLALSLAELFAWDIDFYTDLRQGDFFRMVFEKKYLNGKFSGYGNILAAEFINQGKRFQAFRYLYPDTKKPDYFDPEGKSLRKEFLKSPIKFAHITSRFSFSRLHPIRKVYRAHYGIDYGAPIGTPVQVTADGTVASAGANGASGRMIRISHKNGYETMYLHLQKCLVKKNDKVKEGATIGTVGSSGESTGPHLDYRIKYRGSYINPLSWRFKPVAPLRPEFTAEYKRTVERYCLCLDLPFLALQGLFNCPFPLPL